MASPSWPPAPAYPPPPNAANELRPLSLGEVLDRTFTFFRRNFALIAGIAAIAGAVRLVAGLLQILIIRLVLHRPVVHKQSAVEVIVTVAHYLVIYAAEALAVAATAYAVHEVYLGRTTTVREAYSFVAKRWGTYLLVVFWILASGAWLPALFFIPAITLAGKGDPTRILLAGMLMLFGFLAVFGGIALMLRNLLGAAAAVVENASVRAAMARSKLLTRGAKGHLFMLVLIYIFIYFLPVGVLGIAGGVLVVIKGQSSLLTGSGFYILQAVGLLVAFLTTTLVSPILRIGTMVIYFNQRVRLEAYDLMVLMGQPSAAATPYAPPAPTYTPAADLDFTTAEPLPQPRPIEPEPEPRTDDASQP